MKTQTLSRALAAVTTLGLVTASGVQPSQAQLSGGIGWKAAFYDIVTASTNPQRLGTVMILPDTIMVLPDSIMKNKDFQPGTELWYWDTPSQAYPGAFMLVPSGDDDAPSDKISDYDVFDHDAFDISDPFLMPTVYVDGDDATYAVYDYDSVGQTFSDTLAWFDFQDNGAGDQLAFSDKELGLEYLSIAKHHALVFVSAALPAAGSIEIVEAR